MPRFFQQLPSPTMGVAFVALLAALSGTAVALPGTGSVDSGDIQNNTVRSRDLKNNDVRTQDIRENAVSGADVDESTLGTVSRARFAQNAENATRSTSAQRATSAATATTADSAGSATTAGDAGTVGGQAVQTFSKEIPNDGPPETLLDYGGIQAVANCPGGNTNIDLESTTGLPVTGRGQGNDSSAGPFRIAFSQTSPNQTGLTPGDPHEASGSGTATWIVAGGQMGTVVYAYQPQGVTNTDACLYWGRLISGH